MSTVDLSKLGNIINDGTSGQVLTSQGGSAFSFADAGGGGGSGVTTYSNLTAINAVSSPSEGDLAYDLAADELYLRTTSAWERVAVGPQIGPTLTTTPPATLTLTSGSNSTLTMAAVDESGFPITYDWDAVQGTTVYNSASLPTALTAVSESSGVFTLTPSTNAAHGTTTLKFRAKASDGVLFSPAVSTLSLVFSGYMEFDANVNGALKHYFSASTLTMADYGSWTFTVDAAKTINIKMWGGGGSSSQTTTGFSSPATAAKDFGGAGGYASGTYDLATGTTYTLRVGQGGLRIAKGSGYTTLGSTWLALGGNAANTNSTWIAGGGGYSGFFTGSKGATDYTHGSDVLMIAGGGGAGGFGANNSGGSAGGGTSGQDGGNPKGVQDGTGGTQTAGGTGANWNNTGITGLSLRGAISGSYAADQVFSSGGGGYFGGGPANTGASGGGSGYNSHADVTNKVLTGGSGTTAGNSSDSDRGTAGNHTSTNGVNGKIHITFV
jgi:hypothetical protein